MAHGMQSAAVCLSEPAKPHRNHDLVPKSWDVSPDKGLSRNFMAQLHLWTQGLSDQGERIFVRVESVNKVER